MPFAQRITVSLPSSLAHFPKRALVTGNPVRREILSADPARGRPLEPDVPLVVVTGGGTGALGLNRLVAAAAPRLVETMQVVHLTGRGRGVPAVTDSPRYRAVEFLVDELPHLLAAATVVVSRAGMGTLTELAALRKPTLVDPDAGLTPVGQCAGVCQIGRDRGGRSGGAHAGQPGPAHPSLLADAPRRAELGRAFGASMPTDAAQRIAVELLQLAPG